MFYAKTFAKVLQNICKTFLQTFCFTCNHGLIKEFLILQEAQLPLRNRASAMHFFIAKLLSIAVMTYSYVYLLRNLRPANLLRIQLINFSMRLQHVLMTRDPAVV